jgi:hypothetical protein
MKITVAWDGSLLRANGVAILDGERRRGERVVVGLQIDPDGKPLYLINPDNACQTTATIAIPVNGELGLAEVIYA